jgi:D-glycero-alpha-D-manno-heptose-7-phosphate kinase
MVINLTQNKGIVRSKAPLRLGLAGGGTDVSPFCDEYGGFVLNACINLYSYCTIVPQQNGKISFSCANKQEEFEADLAPSLPCDHYFRIHAGVYNSIVRKFRNGTPLSFKMTTSSDALPGSGLGSSSTMAVAIIQAFTEWLKLPLGEYEIARLAYEVERVDLSLSGGKQDQYAATFGGFNFMEFYESDRVIVNPLRIKSSTLNELESSIVLYFTGVSRDSSKIIDDQRRIFQSSNQDSIAAMTQMKREAVEMKEALLKGDLNFLAESMNRGWEAKKRTSSSISNPLIEHSFEVARKAGAFAGKVSGAGGGGFTLFLVDPTRKAVVVRALEELGGKVERFQFTKYGSQAWTF